MPHMWLEVCHNPQIFPSASFPEVRGFIIMLQTFHQNNTFPFSKTVSPVLQPVSGHIPCLQGNMIFPLHIDVAHDGHSYGYYLHNIITCFDFTSPALIFQKCPVRRT